MGPILQRKGRMASHSAPSIRRGISAPPGRIGRVLPPEGRRGNNSRQAPIGIDGRRVQARL